MTVAQNMAGIMCYACPGMSVPSTTCNTATAIYRDPVESEQIAANTANPVHQPLRQWYQRWAWLLPSGVQNIVKTLTENITVSDGVALVRNKIRTKTETITVSEVSVTRLAAKKRALSTETVTVGAGTATRLKSAIRALATQTTIISDSSVRLTAKFRILATQSVTVGSGTLTRLKAATRTIATQTISISDAVAALSSTANHIVKAIIEGNIGVTDKQLQTLTYDDFQAGTYSFTQGGTSPNSLWTNYFLGGTGATSGVRFSSSISSNVMYLIPQASTSAGETHATENKSATTWDNFDITFKMRTVSQLRTGSSPNAWETAWIIFRYTDDWHHYYFTIKTSGCELGRKDYFPHVEQQIFLATPSSPSITAGTWNTIRIRAISNHFKIWVDSILDTDTPIIDMVDDGTVGYDSNTSGLPVPPTQAMYSGSINPYCEDAEAEFDNFVVTANTGVSVVRLTAKTRTASESVTSSTTTLRLAAKTRTATDSITISSTTTRTKGTIRVLATQSIAVSDSIARLAAKIRTKIESVVISSTTTRTKSVTRTLATQSTTISDAIARLSAKHRTLTDTLNSSSTTVRVKNRLIAVPSQVVSLSDSLGRLKQTVRAAAGGSVGISESVTRRLSKIRTIPTQTVTISDAIARVVAHGQSITKIINESLIVVSDTFYKTRTLIENINLGDLLGFLVTDNTPTNFVKTLTDSIIVSAGNALRTAGKKKALSESTSVNDVSLSITRRTKNRVNIETVNVSDNVTLLKSIKHITKGLTESVTVNDVATRQSGKARRIGGPG